MRCASGADIARGSSSARASPGRGFSCSFCGPGIFRSSSTSTIRRSRARTGSGSTRLRPPVVSCGTGTGWLLARNFSVFSLEIVPEQTAGVDRTLALLHEILTIDEEEEEKFRQQVRQLPAFKSIPLKTRLDEREVAVFSSVTGTGSRGSTSTPGSCASTPSARRWPTCVGYVGRINGRRAKPVSRAIRTTGPPAISARPAWSTRGSGRSTDTPGSSKVEVDARGRVVRTIDSTDPVPGAGSHHRAGRGSAAPRARGAVRTGGRDRGRRPPRRRGARLGERPLLRS